MFSLKIERQDDGTWVAFDSSSREDDEDCLNTGRDRSIGRGDTEDEAVEALAEAIEFGGESGRFIRDVIALKRRSHAEAVSYPKTTPIKPCPFCGHDKPQISGIGGEVFWASCDLCECEGPPARNAKGACDSWNQDARLFGGAQGGTAIPSRPPEGTPVDTLHWLYRDSGAPHWMVATWTGNAWNTLSGSITRPEDLLWWRYAEPAVPPDAPHPFTLRHRQRLATSPIPAATLYARACELVHHEPECGAIDGNGDDDCTCDAVPFLRDLKTTFAARLFPSAEQRPSPTPASRMEARHG